MNTHPFKLTKTQKSMLAMLREEGPFTWSQMRYGFGNQSWGRVFRALERKKLAYFDHTPEAHKTAKHYAAVRGLQPDVLNGDKTMNATKKAKTETRKIKISVCDEQGVILDAGTFEVPGNTRSVCMRWLPEGKTDIWGDAEFDLGK